MTYEEYIQSPEWTKRRAKAIRRAEGRCQLCNSKKQLHVHHRTYERLGDERDADLTVLCRACHKRFHGITNPQASPVASTGEPQQKSRHLRPLTHSPTLVPMPRAELRGERELRWAIARWGPEPFSAKDLARSLQRKSKLSIKLIVRTLEGLADEDELVRVGTKRWRERSATSQGSSAPLHQEHAQPAGERSRP